METDRLNRSKANPWQPVTNPLTIKIVGKLAEECGECTSAASRCLIQGPYECEPDTGKVNREWLEDEIADVFANADLTIRHLGLDRERINERMARKVAFLEGWHSMRGEEIA